MSRTLLALALGAGLALAPARLAAQNWDDDARGDRGEPSHFAINLRIHRVGLSLGNSAVHTGLRLNWSDAGIERINGINVTIWKPGEPLTGTVNGLALGVAGPGAARINGIAIGLGGVVTRRLMRGIAIGGLGVVSNGDIRGISLAGLGAVANHDFSGLGLAGLGVVANGSFEGIGISGLGTVANGDFKGFGFGVVGTVANGNMTGVAIGGVGAVTNGYFAGIGIGGVGMVANRGITGIAIGGIGVASDGVLRGGALAGYMVRVREVHGFSAAVLRVKTNTLRGVSIAGFNQVRRMQVGLSIGLLNYARELHGAQIGVLNIAGNNRWPWRVLPFLNLHLAKRTDQEEGQQ